MYTISHIPLPACTSNRTCLSYIFIFFHFLFIFILPKTRVRAIVHTFLMFFLFIPPETGVRLSVTSTLHFCDTLHFTITTTTTTTMTTPTTKPPPPPPRAQTRPPPFQEQTGLETQLRLESQVYFFPFLCCFFFRITNTFIYSVYGMRATTRKKKGPNDARHVIWALGVFSLKKFLRFIDNKSPQHPTTANEGQHRPTRGHSSPRKVNAGPR